MTILTVGNDLAKNVFAVHGVNQAGKAGLFARPSPIGAAMTVCSLASPHVVVLPAPAGATAAGLEGNTDEEMARKAGHQGFVWLDERGSPCS